MKYESAGLYAPGKLGANTFSTKSREILFSSYISISPREREREREIQWALLYIARESQIFRTGNYRNVERMFVLYH